ncbi:MAG: 3-deoxy-D-manno-octulosonic acid transferase [Planctomycetes bacterium]|nr:3-deoxy-D-manno-octulosonic acid transferase [Planctomycetota bacterium]
MNFIDLLYLALLTPFGFALLIKSRLRKIFAFRIGQRLGNTTLPGKKSGKRIWIHAASVGEVNLVKPLISKLAGRNEDIVLSVFTDTGMQAANKAFPHLPAFILPLDFSFLIKRILKTVKPDVIVLVESELWPNLITESRRQNVPIILINARVTESSLKKYRLFSGFYRQLFDKFAVIAAQNAAVAERILSLGVCKNKVSVTGSMKYDLDYPQAELENAAALREKFGFMPRDTVIAAGSTHEPEEEIILRSFAKLREKRQNLRLIIAPRHIERLNDVRNAVSKAGYEAALYSEALKHGPIAQSGKTCLIVDTVGDLMKIYAVADIVFVGGSLVSRGGQNILEPASLKKPVVFGNSMRNFAEPAQALLKNNAALQVQNEAELHDALEKLASEPGAAGLMGQKAAETIKTLQGATKKHLNLIYDII